MSVFVHKLQETYESDKSRLSMFSGPFLRVIQVLVLSTYCTLSQHFQFRVRLHFQSFIVLLLSHHSQSSRPCYSFHPLQICQKLAAPRGKKKKCYRSIKCISVVNTVIFPDSHLCETINKSLIYTISTIKCISHCIQSLISLLFLIMSNIRSCY